MDSIEQAAGGQGSLSVEITGDVIEELVGQLSTRRRAEDRRRLREARIRRAMEVEGALGVVFQPIFDLMRSQTVGVEALARFHMAPDRGPDRWFAEADEVGLRRDLELVALHNALSHLGAIPDSMFLSVNISPATLRASRFRRALDDVDASRIVVEVTEHMPVEDYTALNAALDRVRELGVRLAIDDAGAGFASLRDNRRRGNRAPRAVTCAARPRRQLRAGLPACAAGAAVGDVCVVRLTKTLSSAD